MSFVINAHTLVYPYTNLNVSSVPVEYGIVSYTENTVKHAVTKLRNKLNWTMMVIFQHTQVANSAMVRPLTIPTKVSTRVISSMSCSPLVAAYYTLNTSCILRESPLATSHP